MHNEDLDNSIIILVLAELMPHTTLKKKSELHLLLVQICQERIDYFPVAHAYFILLNCIFSELTQSSKKTVVFT